MRGDKDRIVEEATIVEPADDYQPRPEGLRFAEGMLYGVAGGIVLWVTIIAFFMLVMTR